VVYRYLLFNKPYGVLSQFSEDESGHPTLKTYIDVPEVYPVGRLDRDSEGLLLLTNHGQLQHRLCDPKFAHPRTYWVQVENIPTANAIQQLQQGVIIQGQLTRPAKAKLLVPAPVLPERQPPIRYRQQIPTAWIELCLTEGRNRQVRRMTAAVGFPTLRLVRVKIGELGLGQLTPGTWRELTPTEQTQLYRLTQLGQTSLKYTRPKNTRDKSTQNKGG
jgi:23S rRNA pseudouridine2457 synthase